MKAVDIQATIQDVLTRRGRILISTTEPSMAGELVARDIMGILNLCVGLAPAVVYYGEIFRTSEPIYFSLKVDVDAEQVSLILSTSPPPTYKGENLHGGFIWGNSTN